MEGLRPKYLKKLQIWVKDVEEKSQEEETKGGGETNDTNTGATGNWQLQPWAQIQSTVPKSQNSQECFKLIWESR